MKIIYFANFKINSGPSNVDNELYKSLSKICKTKRFNCPNSKIARIVKYCLFSFFIALKYNVCIFSSYNYYNLFIQKIFHVFNKKSILIGHGHWGFENKINNMGIPERNIVLSDKFFLKNDAVIAVSRIQKDFLQKQYPQYKKIYYIYNGVNEDEFKQTYNKHIKKHSTDSSTIKISLSGGTRPIKNNQQIIKVSEILAKDGFSCIVEVFGRCFYASKKTLRSSNKNVSTHFNGHLNNSDFIERLSSTDIFVLNSVHEPFGLVLFDALSANIPILITENCGCKDICDFKAEDIIMQNDTNEIIANKILYQINNSNNSRLTKSIRYDLANYDQSAKKIYDICKAKTTNKPQD